MFRHFWLVLMFTLSVSQQTLASAAQSEIDAVLDSFHQAASAADSEKYFGLMHSNMIFIGTDASERWNKATFKQYAQPHFEKGKGWTYMPRDRHITVADTAKLAWFDEMLDSKNYGECRGTGVLEWTADGWKISQYHLTVSVPNDLLEDLVEKIKQQPLNK
jgi:ketosteroid isomerase-like protein